MLYSAQFIRQGDEAAHYFPTFLVDEWDDVWWVLYKLKEREIEIELRGWKRVEEAVQRSGREIGRKGEDEGIQEVKKKEKEGEREKRQDKG